MGVAVKVASNGRMVLPAVMRRQMGIAKGGTLIANERDGTVELKSLDQIVATAQALHKQAVGHLPNSTVADFLIERKLDWPD